MDTYYFDATRIFGSFSLLLVLHSLLLTTVVAPPYGWDKSGSPVNSSIKATIIDTALKHEVWQHITAWVNVSYSRNDRHKILVSSTDLGRYGSGPPQSFRGFVLHSIPIDACSRLQNHVKTAYQPWIALIIRGGCTFSTKAKHAADAGAAGIIVYNYYGDLTTMDLEGSKIPGVMLQRENTNTMTSGLGSNENVWVDISMARNLTVTSPNEGASVYRWSRSWLLLTACLSVAINVL